MTKGPVEWNREFQSGKMIGMYLSFYKDDCRALASGWSFYWAKIGIKHVSFKCTT